MSTTEPIRDKQSLRAIADYFLENKNYRNHAMFILGIHTTLRISDLLKLQWSDVYDEKHHQFHTHLTITEQKTNKTKTIALNKCAIDALRLYSPYRKGKWIFASRNGDSSPITRQQAWRIMNNTCKNLGIDAKIACHGLRKTWGYHAWSSQSVSPVIIMDVYNHANYRVTKRYLGIAQDDLDDAYLNMNFFN